MNNGLEIGGSAAIETPSIGNQESYVFKKPDFHDYIPGLREYYEFGQLKQNLPKEPEVEYVEEYFIHKLPYIVPESTKKEARTMSI